MNNCLCLGIFFFMVWFKELKWDYGAEVWGVRNRCPVQLHGEWVSYTIGGHETWRLCWWCLAPSH